MRRFIYFTITTFLLSCSSTKEIVVATKPINYYIEETTTDLKNWYHKDIYTDSIPGISLEKAYKDLLQNQQGDTIVIAIIDSPIDIKHEYLANNIWTNVDEIANNNIDDDNNGYIDDVHGWNFMGNQKGENQIYFDMEFNRILKKYKAKNISNDLEKRTYEKVLKAYDSMITDVKKEKEYYTMMYNSYHQADTVLMKYFHSKDYSIAQLDSLKLQHPKDTTIQSAVLRITNFRNYIGLKNIEENYELYTNYIKVLTDDEFDERHYIGDDVHNVLDKNYGNNQVNHNIDILRHGTLVSGVLAQSKEVDNEIQGVVTKAEIMPVSISGYGNEHDKDISIAIRYAVDNGAKVINISFGKEFSLHKEWVFDAFEYAEKNDVLIVSSAGNSSYDLEAINNYYPNDNENNEEEVSNNFLLVGASTYILDEKLVASFSNYGKTDVDIFAPGKFIYTTAVGNKYEFQRGTSMSAAITSGIAALIRSYYPNLSATEVKQIIMESGISYDIMVNKPSTSKEKELVPFSSLSKSGKIVNAYNALLLAEKISKAKKK